MEFFGAIQITLLYCLIQHTVESSLAQHILSTTIPFIAVYDKNKSLCFLKVVLPH